jgi:diguanylate cyclase (GGDEF)-like protein
MKVRENNYKLLHLVVLIGGIASIILSIAFLPSPKLDWQLVILALVTIFFSSKLHFQLPKTKIHFSVADVLILFAVLNYGGGVAVFLALFESLFTSYSFKRKGINIKPKTFILNAATHTLSVFITAIVIYNLFSPVETVINNSNNNVIILLMLFMGVTQFFSNSILISVFASGREGKSAWEIWNETFLNLGLLYLAEAILSVLIYKLVSQTNFFLVVVTVGLATIIYVTYRRYIDEIRETAALAEKAERDRTESEKLRAEQAEQHIKELRKLLGEQERTSQELLESKNQFRHAAYHDNLTDLPNRNSVVDYLSELLSTTKSNPGNEFIILYLDINSFKYINDSLGYSFGDKLLIQVAKRLSDAVQEGTIVARFSSDEFAFVLTEDATKENAVTLANTIYEKISEPFNLQGRQVFTSSSIGIALSNPNYDMVEDILRDAEIAMYQAKETQKSYVIFDRSMHDCVIERIQLENDLRQAIKREEFCLHYQPIVDLENVKIVGFEALVRWNHPQNGVVAPYKFISIAEDTGLIIPMTEWIIREACQQVRKWQAEFNPDLTVSVNISGKHFAKTNLVDLIKKVLLETNFNPAQLNLEITESTIMEDAEKAISILIELKTLGVKLLIDDFGTGYSSLSYLHKFPIDTLKVDRSFVSTMENEDENNEIVNTIILMAKNLRLDVVAEGIETINQLYQLRRLRCEKGQGFFFSRPIPGRQIENLLRDSAPWQEIIQTQGISFVPPIISTISEDLKIN